MERCAECSVCIGIYCDKHKTRCDICGEEFVTADLWTVNGRNYCNECYGRLNRWGSQANAKDAVEKLS